MSTIRTIVRKMVPSGLRGLRHRWAERKANRAYTGDRPEEVFGRIYADGRWGGAPGEFSSGGGSHDPAIVDPYVDAVRSFGLSAPSRLDAVDLGCGDFNVGSRIRDVFGAYRAFDVVPALIRRNQEIFADADVEFGCLDITRDPLPHGDVAMIRQVLQHLSNRQIAQVLSKLSAFRYLIVTEHLPAEPGFVPNRDKLPGAAVRCVGAAAEHVGLSGVVLTAPPLSLRVKSERLLCQAVDRDNPRTVVSTSLYELA